jgi:hypothetical protein
MFSFLFFVPSTWRKRSPNHQPHAIPSRKCCEPRKMTNKRNKTGYKKKNQERINAQVKLIRSRMKKRESSP